MAAKFFPGLPMDGPDPECVQGFGEGLLAAERNIPSPAQDHSRSAPVNGRRAATTPVPLTLLTTPPRRPAHLCDESPV